MGKELSGSWVARWVFGLKRFSADFSAIFAIDDFPRYLVTLKLQLNESFESWKLLCIVFFCIESNIVTVKNFIHQTLSNWKINTFLSEVMSRVFYHCLFKIIAIFLVLHDSSGFVLSIFSGFPQISSIVSHLDPQKFNTNLQK